MNYKIIGGDGREYGPVSLDELKNWVREGRIGRESLICREDVGVWLSAEKFSELQPDLRDIYAKSSAMQQSSFEAVGFWARLGAFLIDSIVLVMGFVLIWQWIEPTLAAELPKTRDIKTWKDIIDLQTEMMPYTSSLLMVYLPMHFIYDVLLNGTFGATVGKMLIGARIVKLDGERIGYGTAILRHFAARISDWTCYIGYLLVAFRDDKRALHDLIAGTRVIYKR